MAQSQRAPAVLQPSVPEAFTIVVLPDTQYYAGPYAEIFAAQTEWIAANRVALNIQYVLHLGDVTEFNSDVEWTDARTAMSVLCGQVPYAIATGNHDYGPGGDSSTRDSLFNSPTHFGPGSEYATQPSVGGFFEQDRTDNSWHTFHAGGQPWIVMALEWGPRDDVVAWAHQVFEAHPNHTKILITHAYMYHDGTRYDWGLLGGNQSWTPHAYGLAGQLGGVNDGWELWDKLVRKHDVALVFNGHVLGQGTGRQTSIGDHGQVVHQMLSNYQGGVTGSVNGGNGFLRLIEVQRDHRTVHVKTFSPYTGESKTEPDQDFHLGLFAEPIATNPHQAVQNELSELHYRLEREEESVVVNEGTLGAALTGTYTGPGPTASEFDGVAGYVETLGRLPGLEQWSIAAWVRTESSASQTVVTNDQDGWNDDVLLGLAPEGSVGAANRWAVVHQDDDSQTRTVVESPHDTQADRWYHLVATSDGNSLRLYVDGEFVAQAPAAAADLDFRAGPLRVGQSAASAGNGHPFNGSIADVALFARELSLTDVTELRLAAFQRVTAGRISALGPTDPGDDSVGAAEVSADAYPGILTLARDEGDFQVGLGQRGLNFHEGVLLATVSQNVRAGLHATVEVERSGFSDGILSLSVMQAGSTAGRNEVNFDTAVAWFPFHAGWTGAHVDANGTLADGRGVDAGALVQTQPGRFLLDLGVDSRTDGMLFTIGGSDADHIVPTAPLSNGAGWDLRVQSSSSDFLLNGGSGEAAPFSLLHVPYSAKGLVGGRYDGRSGVDLRSVGSSAMLRLGTGEYQLTIPDHSPDTGMLLLTVAGHETNGSLTAPADNFLTYEDDGQGRFLIHSRDAPHAVLEDTQFVWAFTPWPSDLEP